MERKTQACPECGGVMEFGIHAHKITYKQASQVVELECWKCADCGEVMMRSDLNRPAARISSRVSA